MRTLEIIIYVVLGGASLAFLVFLLSRLQMYAWLSVLDKFLNNKIIDCIKSNKKENERKTE